jgi:hypothetical protein
MVIWGISNNDCDTDAKTFWKQEEASGTLVTSADLCDEPWSLWIQGEKLSSNVKGNICSFISDLEVAKTRAARGYSDTEDIDVPAIRQAVKSTTISR